MKIEAELWGQLKQAAGTGTVQLEIPESATVDDAVRQLANDVPALGGMLLEQDGSCRPWRSRRLSRSAG